MKLSDKQCKDIISTLRRKGKEPAARVSPTWHSAGGRIGQYSHEIQYGSTKPRRFDTYELYRKLGGYDVIVEISIPGVYGWNGWIEGETKYSTDLEDVSKNCTYDSGTSINIWKVPATMLKKIESEPPTLPGMDESTKVPLTFEELKEMMDESYESNWNAYAQEESVVVNALDKIWNKLDDLLDSTKYGSSKFKKDMQTALDSIKNAKRNYMV